MSYRVCCGDCATVLGQRLRRLAGVDRLLSRHRLATGCAGGGLVVAPMLAREGERVRGKSV